MLPVYGCTDSRAGNYDSLANVDDGSCYLVDLDDPVDPIGGDGGDPIGLIIKDSNDIDDLGGICDPDDPNCEA